METIIRRLDPTDLALLRELNAMFGATFDDPLTYGATPPDDAYLEALLSAEHIHAIVALAGEKVVGGLVAYELDKFESRRKEVYLYDLAVDAAHRRQRIATALIERLSGIAKQRGAWTIFVQADYGDEAAIHLYEKIGRREEVLHFDLLLDQRP